MKKILLIGLALSLVLGILHNIDVKNKETLTTLENEVQKPVTTSTNKNVILGTAFTPANFPGSSIEDIKNTFTLADEVGNQVILIGEWDSDMDPKNIILVRDMTHAQGMQFHYHISPISLDNQRRDPAIPKNAGGDSFGDAPVRTAFIAYALAMAELKPDVLGLGTEVDLLAKNPQEFDQYVSLAKETYDAVKKKYPKQTITISFQWDNLRKEDPAQILPLFKDSLDVYSFTTYPYFFYKDPAEIPDDYYTAIRTYLPTERIGFSEIGWASKGSGSEETQATYYGMLPDLMRDTKPEYAIFGMLHDINVFGLLLASLNSVGLRNNDGTPKESWNTVINLKF
jgi:hypothetical protein